MLAELLRVLLVLHLVVVLLRGHQVRQRVLLSFGFMELAEILFVLAVEAVQ